ncbi:MAG: hypothetical protein ACFFB0_13575 [Promethearchaeota archaeon]
MVNKRIVAIILVLIFGFSMTISIPIIILSAGFSPLVTIVETIRFEDTKYNSSAVEELNLIADVGNIKIQYITLPVEYCAMIEVNFDMVGYNLFGRTSSYYFNFPENKSFNNLFNLELQSDTDWFDTSKWIKQNVSIVVSINSNILFNINTTIREEGDVNIYVSGGTIINNIDVNIKTGDIVYDLIFCSMRGNIIGNVDSGDITLKANNVKYTQNNIWNLTNNKGKIALDIIQTRLMGANLTGTGESNSGKIILKYRDYSSDIGAIFKFYNSSEVDWHTLDNVWRDFNGPIPLGHNGAIFKSYDFPNNFNYDFSFFIAYSNPKKYKINLTSV